MIYGEAGTILCRAYDTTTNLPVEGIAASLSCKISKNGTTPVNLTDTTADEQGSGYYVFSHTADEATANTVDPILVSSVANVVVVPVNYDRQVKTVTTITETVTVKDTSETFEALQNIIGPKRVKTKEVEIEAHDPLKLQSLRERIASKSTRFGQFGGTYVVPKNSKWPCNEKDRTE